MRKYKGVRVNCLSSPHIQTGTNLIHVHVTDCDQVNTYTNPSDEGGLHCGVSANF